MSAKRESKAWPTAATFCFAAALLLSGCYSDGMSGDFNVTVIGEPPPEPVQPPPYTEPLYVIGTDPEANETWVSPDNLVIRAYFSEWVKPASFDPSMFTVTDNAGVAVAGVASCDGTGLEFRPTSPLASVRYTASLAPGLEDSSGHRMVSGNAWSFTVAPPGTGAWRSMNLTGNPGARLGASAVWTGSEMVAWGGIYLDPFAPAFSYSADTGGRYDPASDSWRPTSTVAAPPARHDHTAVWTGTEMIVWGGISGGNMGMITGGRYNPVTDSWLPVTTVGAPTGRSGHTAVWTGTEMIVWGGGVGSAGATGGRYDPGRDSWRPMSTQGAPSSRYDHTAVWTGTEMIVWGGISNETGARLNTGARYDPVKDAWTPMPTDGAPWTHFGHKAVWTGSEMILWGRDSSARYRTVSNTWMPLSTANPPPGRDGATAVWTGSQIIFFGGVPADSVSSPKFGIRYVPSTDSWGATTVAGAPGLSWPVAVWTGTEMIVWGVDADPPWGRPAAGGRYTP